MKEWLQTVVRGGNLVITISEQVAPLPEGPLLDAATEFLGARPAANVMLDLSLLHGPAGRAALYRQMATAVSSAADWWPLPLLNDCAELAPLP